MFQASVGVGLAFTGQWPRSGRGGRACTPVVLAAGGVFGVGWGHHIPIMYDVTGPYVTGPGRAVRVTASSDASPHGNLI